MGVINVTPDSFSGDGIYRDVGAVADRAAEFIEQGAAILDVGGESTRPGFRPVAPEEELARVIPAVRALVRITSVPVSVDTRQPDVAERALAEGVKLINDVSGLADPRMTDLAAREGCGLVCMYNGGLPLDADTGPFLLQAVKDVVKRAQSFGVRPESIIVDPGLGFGKQWKENFAVMCHLQSLSVMRLPILVGPSRKRMISRALGDNQRVREGSLALAAICAANGATIIRAHDVRDTVKTVHMIDALRQPERFPQQTTLQAQ